MFHFRWAALIFLNALCMVSATGSAIAAADEVLLDAADAEVRAYLETLERLAAIESGSADTEGLLAVADHLEQRLNALGFTTARHRSNAGAGADTVVGRKTGRGKQNVMPMAHFDTVYAPGILDTFPYRIEGDKFFGPGVADAKGGVAMILHSLKILNDAGWDDFATISVLFNPDEEVGSPGSHQIITDLASEADTVLSFEPT